MVKEVAFSAALTAKDDLKHCHVNGFAGFSEKKVVTLLT